MGKQARLNQQYRTRMQAVPAAQEQELLALMPGAVNAPMWERQGKEWSPDLHVTSGGKMRDPAGWRATIETLRKYGSDAVAFFYYQPDLFGPGGFSLEVEFSKMEIGSQAVSMWNSFFPEEESDEDEFDVEDAA